MNSLFDENTPDQLETDRAEVATDFDVKCQQFLNRWHWRGPSEVVRRELDALIDEAVRTQIP